MKSRHSITSAAWECPRWLVSNPQLLKKQSHFFCFLLSFHSYTYGMWRSPGSGSSGSCSCRSTPQPQPRQIRATSATYTKACGNARALTHRVRPGIKPTSSWILVRFVFAAPQWELPLSKFLLQFEGGTGVAR